MKIIQTKVDQSKIDRNNVTISQLYSLIENLKKQNKLLSKSFFCGKEILLEEETDHNNEKYKMSYELIVYMTPEFKMEAGVYLDQRNEKRDTYVVRIDESGVNWNYPKWWKDNWLKNDDVRKTRHGVKSFEEAKKLARRWLAEVIEKYCED